MPLRYADRRSRGRGFRAPVLAVLGCACSESRRVARRMPWRCVDRLPSAVRPSPVPQNPSLHPPSPQCRRSTNSIDTRTLRSASLDSTLPRRPHLHRVDAYTLAEITPPRKLRARRPPSRVRGCCMLRTSSAGRHCSLLVLQLVISEHAASLHAPCACRCCCAAAIRSALDDTVHSRICARGRRPPPAHRRPANAPVCRAESPAVHAHMRGGTSGLPDPSVHHRPPNHITEP